jgi:hypothetical protein
VSARAGRVTDAPAPDLIEPVVGFRNWRVIDGVLTSPYSAVAWREPVLCARCLSAPHHAPAPGCDCGVSAYHDPQLRFSTVDFRGVSGIVSMWGRLEVHDDRIRAEFARVEALAFHERWSARQRHAVAAVAAELGADLIGLDEQPEAASSYGAVLTPSLMPA